MSKREKFKPSLDVEYRNRLHTMLDEILNNDLAVACFVSVNEDNDMQFTYFGGSAVADVARKRMLDCLNEEPDSSREGRIGQTQ